MDPAGLEAAERLMAAGDLAGLERWARDAALRHPGAWRPLMLLGGAVAAHGRPEEAWAHAERAVRLAATAGPAEQADALAGQADILLRTEGSFDAAHDAIRRSIELDPSDPARRTLSAWVQVRRRRYGEALMDAAGGDGSAARGAERVSVMNLLMRWTGWSALGLLVVGLLAMWVSTATGALASGEMPGGALGSAAGLVALAAVTVVVWWGVHPAAVWPVLRRSGWFWTVTVIMLLTVLGLVAGVAVGIVPLPAVIPLGILWRILLLRGSAALKDEWLGFLRGG